MLFTNSVGPTHEAISPSGFYIQLREWRSVSKNPFQMGCRFAPIYKTQLATPPYQNGIESRQFDLDDNYDSSQFECTRSSRREWTRLPRNLPYLADSAYAAMAVNYFPLSLHIPVST